MKFIRVEDRLINLSKLRSILLGDKMIVFNFTHDDWDRQKYNSQDEAIIAFSNIKLEIEQIQNANI